LEEERDGWMRMVKYKEKTSSAETQLGYLTAIENIGVYLVVRKTKNKRKLCIDDFYAVI
jgi:hypothetical protein